jgi:6-phosphogluconolactonase
MQLHIYKNVEETVIALADWMTELIRRTLEVKDRFTIALSGGETPKKLYRTLASDRYRGKINWNKLHFFWGDERMIPINDERSNAKMAYEYLLDHVDIPSSNIHTIFTDIVPDESALHYEKILHQYFDVKQITFDLALLGMGDDGHTLSLFPGSEALKDEQSWVKADNTEQKGMKRITLMPTVINRSAAIVFLVTGENKATVLAEIISNPTHEKYPAQLIQPANGELYWFLDEAAAKNL